MRKWMVNTGSGNDLSHVWHQGITWINDDLLSIKALMTTKFIEIGLKLLQGNIFENTISKPWTILLGLHVLSCLTFYPLDSRELGR